MIEIKQRWDGVDRWIMSDGASAAILDIYDEPRDGYVKSLLWSLSTNESERGKGHATALLEYIENLAKRNRQTEIFLEWSLLESPRWVLDWYLRKGYDERAFGRDVSLLSKNL